MYSAASILLLSQLQNTVANQELEDQKTRSKALGKEFAKQKKEIEKIGSKLKGLIKLIKKQEIIHIDKVEEFMGSQLGD